MLTYTIIIFTKRKMHEQFMKNFYLHNKSQFDVDYDQVGCWFVFFAYGETVTVNAMVRC